MTPKENLIKAIQITSKITIVSLCVAGIVIPVYDTIDSYFFPDTDSLPLPPRIIKITNDIEKVTNIKHISVKLDKNIKKRPYAANIVSTVNGPLINLTPFIIYELTDSELRTILFHEIGHYVNNDQRKNTAITFLPVILLTTFMLYAYAVKGQQPKVYVNPYTMLALTAIIYFPIYGMSVMGNVYIQHLSQSEIRADNYAKTHELRWGDTIDALSKIPFIESHEEVNDIYDHVSDRAINYMAVFNIRTHPSMEDRIMQLVKCDNNS